MTTLDTPCGEKKDPEQGVPTPEFVMLAHLSIELQDPGEGDGAGVASLLPKEGDKAYSWGTHEGKINQD